jgi:MFS family permease
MFGYRSILQERARPAAVRDSPRAPWLAVGVVCFGAFMGQLDASIVTIIFPAVQHDFHAGVAAVQWVSLSYLLGLVALLAPAGRLGDAVGRKLVYSCGFAAFTAASLACSLAPSLSVLVALRLIQAAGAAMLQSNSVALVTTSAPKDRMRFALGIQAGAQSVGLALGPTLGGLLTSTLGWRAVFWVNVPVGIVAIVAARYLLPRTRRFSRVEEFDWLGTLLLAAWTSALLLVLSAASGLSLPGWMTALLLAVGIGGLLGFAVRQARARYPLIPVWVLRSAPLALALAGAACGYLTLFGPLVLIPQVLGHGRGSMAGTGLLLSALPLGFGLAATIGDVVLPHRWGNRRRGFAGAALAAAVMVTAIFVPVTAATVIPLLALAGFGLGVFVPANNAVIMLGGESRAGPPGGFGGKGFPPRAGGVWGGSSPRRQQSASADSSASLLGGLISMARGIGTTLGISLMALALHLGASRGYAGPMQARPAFVVLAIVATAAAVIALAGPSRTGGQDDRPREADPSGAFS